MSSLTAYVVAIASFGGGRGDEQGPPHQNHYYDTAFKTVVLCSLPAWDTGVDRVVASLAEHQAS